MYRNQLEEFKTDNSSLQKENEELKNKFKELKMRTGGLGETA